MSTIPGFPIDLDAYLARVEYRGALDPTLEVLEGLHLAHATHIPFENIDVLLGRPIRLDLESLQAKLIGDRRGGYCFEQNSLLAAVLRQVGFRVVPLAARVRLGADRITPRTHMLLKVDVSAAAYLADVGFGGECLLKPLPLLLGHETDHFGRVYRLVDDGGQYAVQSRHAGGWEDLYAFNLEPQLAVDFEVANHFTATHPSSIFVQHLFVQRTTPEASYRLFDRKYSVRKGDEVSSREIEDDGERHAILAEHFGLRLAPGTRLPAPTATG